MAIIVTLLGRAQCADDQALVNLREGGNWKGLRQEALRQLDAMSADDARAGKVWNELQEGLSCGNEIALYDEMFAKYAVGKFSGNVAFWADANWEEVPSYGVIIGNEFKRGNNRGIAGRKVTCGERDRGQVLALMAAAIPNAEKAEPQLKSKFFCNLAQLLLRGRNSGSSYKLQVLTDFAKLPDYDMEAEVVSSISRPPVHPDGSPVLYQVPSTWGASANDGERLRFAWEQAGNKKAKQDWADFLCGQFDFLVAEKDFRSEYYVIPLMKQFLYDLGDNETIADLADGVRRITLPEGFNYIALYQELGMHYRLGEIYASRMQFEKAAEEFRQDGSDEAKRYYEQICGKWGTPCKRGGFGGMGADLPCSSPAGTELTMPYYFRNANKVTVNLYHVEATKAVERLLKMYKAPSNRNVSLWNMARRDSGAWKMWKDLIGQQPEKTLTFELHPAAHHWETCEYLKFGKQEPGAFVAEFIPDDNEASRVYTMIWTADCALTTQVGAGNGKVRMFLNEPVSGRPIGGATLKIHSFYYSYGEPKEEERHRISTEILTFTTDANGIAEFAQDDFKQPKGSRVSARCILAETAFGKLTLLTSPYLHFDSGKQASEDWRTFMITDKTVYKPGDDIAFTGYLRTPSYGDTEVKKYHGKTVTLAFINPQYNEAFKKEVPFDEATQSFTFEMKLPADAMLGTWEVSVKSIPGCTSFKVEEYKKPEYLLTVAPPSKPVKAGEKVPVTMEAKYYFGAPMPNAEISYKVFRSEMVPLCPFVFAWNWLYGAHYAFCTASYQDENLRNVNYGRVLIRSGKGRTDASGRLTIEIDSADAVAKFGERDFRYSVDAEVRDASNRVVSGSGSVIAAVKPFTVAIYTPWGFARTGARQQVEIAAETPDGEKVKGQGTLRIFRRALNGKGVPERVGAPVKTMSFVPGAPEMPEFILNQEGVYELSAEVVAEDGGAVTSSLPFFVYGEKQGTELFGEFPISISTDKPTYRPGDKAKILVACDKPGRSIYFIARSERDAAIQCVTLDGYSRLFEIPIATGDQPNFFVDVMSYQEGKMLTLRKQIIVPPEKKVLDVTAKPGVDKVRPGSVLPIKVTVTDLDGKPVAGNVTVAVYDKSLEAISKGAMSDIRPFFWGWTRHCNLGFQHNLHQHPASWDYMNKMLFDIESRFSLDFHSDDGTGRAGCFVLYNASFASDLMAAPAPDMMVMGAMKNEMAMDTRARGENAQEENAPAVLRTNFQDRAFWAGRINLTDSGEANLAIPMPDNMTTWVLRVWSLSNDTRVGEARTEILVSKDLVARLELPRFMRQGDVVNAVVTINNTTDRALGKVETTLLAPDLLKTPHSQTLTLGANGSASYEVPLVAGAVGEYSLKLSAKADQETDALELKLPVLVKGVDRQVSYCGRLDAAKSKAVIELDIPEARKPETTAFSLSLSPSAAKGMMELLPYLVADDSGDVFGFVNRFMPALSAKLALQNLGIAWKDAAPSKTARDALYSEYMRRYTLNGTAVPSFKAEDFDRVVTESLRMVRKMVNSDGGWGWFGAYREKSWPDTTAYVLDALLELNDSEDSNLLQSGVAWLESHAAKRVAEIKSDQKMSVFVSNTDCLVARVLAKAGKPNEELMSLCFRERVKCLAPYGYAMLALAYGKDTEEAKQLLRNLEQFLKVDDENGTAYLNIPSYCCFFWYGNENETLSAYLELLLRENPQSVTARKVANYLVTNVRNSPWRNSTRSLGAAVRALAKYIVASQEDRPDFTVIIRDGSQEHKFAFNGQNMWKCEDVALFLPAEKLKSGKRSLELEFDGAGALYWNARLNYFSLEDRIEPAGLEMKIQRNYYRLVQDESASALLAGKNGRVQQEGMLKYRRVPLLEGDSVKPGDLVEVELISTAKNDYDYVVFQDAMPAGFEYEAPISGWRWNCSAPMYVEYKERGAKFYLRNMARGQSNAFYRIRAQLCGTVTALPARGYGIYAQELKCNGAQQTLRTLK